MLWETMIQWAPVVLRKCFDTALDYHHFILDDFASLLDEKI